MERETCRKLRWFWAWQDDREEEWLGSMSAWQYFRKEARPGEEPEIFTDPESKIRKYRRILQILVVIFPILLIGGGTSWRNLTKGGVLGGVLICIIAGVQMFYLVAILRILQRIRRLKNPPCG